MPPSSIVTKNSIPTARTKGSANGSSISWRGSLVAIARPAATIVAVAPTLDAKSQLSSSLRAMIGPQASVAVRYWKPANFSVISSS